MSSSEPTRAVLDERDRQIGAGVRALVDGSPALTIDEVRARSVMTPRPARPAARSSSTAWRLAAAAAVVLVLVGVAATWRSRSGERPLPLGPVATGQLLPIPDDPTGPVAAENTGDGPGEPDRSTSAGWDVVRTGADDRQLVVFFSGISACTTAYRAEVTETPESVAIAVFAVPPSDRDAACPLISAGPGAIGIQLDQPLGTRRLEGSRAVIGNDVTGPLVVPGADLATLTWPTGATRATNEDLGRGLGPEGYVWTQTFTDRSVVIEPPEDSSDMARNPSISLQQWFGASAIDDGAGVQACQFQQPRTTEAVEVNGAPATLVTCAPTGAKDSGGAIAVLWMDQRVGAAAADRLMLRAEPGSIDVDGLLALAESVRRGG